MVTKILTLGLTAGLLLLSTGGTHSQGMLDSLRGGAKTASDYIPSLPSVSKEAAKEIASQAAGQVADLAVAQFDEFTVQIAEVIPELDRLGFEVATFRVKMGLPPKAKLRFKSKNTDIDDSVLTQVASKSASGLISSYMISTAISARRLQKVTGMGTAVIDVDFAMPPKVKLSFLKGRNADLSDIATRFEDIDLLCGQAIDD